MNISVDYDLCVKANRTYRTMLVDMKVGNIKETIDQKLKRFIGLIDVKRKYCL